MIICYYILFSDKMAVMADKRCWSALYVGLTLAVLLTLPHASDAQTWCTSLIDAFSSYNCVCRPASDSNDVVLDCSNQDLTSVPSMAPGKVLPTALIIHEFILANNSITRLEDNSFQNFRVNALDLSGNSIASVSDGAFDPLIADLRELRMDGNFTEPPKSALNSLKDLEILTLGDYKVNYLGDSDHLYFFSFKHLKRLTLRQWKIIAIEIDAFKGPNSLQSLTLLQEQDMVNLPLDIFTQDYLKNLKNLKISMTSIVEVGEKAFSDSMLNDLEELDLSDNLISDIKANSLEGLGLSLRKLSFASNYLRSDTSDLTGLSNLPRLEELDLSGNEDINVIPDFSQLNLADQTDVKIFLGNNNINTLSSNAFSGIAPRLHTLDLSQNRISSMAPDSFNEMANLHVLRLSQQRGVTTVKFALPSSLSESANSLTHLFLNGLNLDESSVSEVLPHMANLEVLDLSHTGLTQVPNLQKMVNLQELYLTGNSLTFLNQDHLIGPRETLKKLYLSQNPIKLISSCIFAHYTSFPITLALQSVQLECNCSLAWLQRAATNGRINLTHPPLCSNFNIESLLSKNATICPNDDFKDPPCENPYTTTPPPTTPRPPSLTLKLVKVTSNSLTLSWSLSNTVGTLRSFDVKITNSYGNSEFIRNDLHPRFFQVEATPLLPDTQHKVCVIANFQSINSVTECTFIRTEKGSGSGASGQEGDSDSDNAGIIIGAVAAAVLLLIILAAIFYLVVVRRRPKKNSGPTSTPVQPRNFAKSELPSMSEDSRTFTRPKRPVDNHDGMQVVAISDGQVNDRHARNGSARVGRAAMLHSDGSYKLMSAGDSSTEGTSGIGSVSGSQSLYENDRGLLPKTPPYHDHGLRGPRQPGYYNEAFEQDKYDEIDMQREVTV